MSKIRLETFSDAVIAIIMTLLILELHVPVVATHTDLAGYVAIFTPLIPNFISFVLSFMLIAIHWVSHHYFFSQLNEVPLGIVWLNNLFLLWLCFIPFPTTMLGEHPTDQFPILLYAVNQLLIALTFFALRSYASKNKLFADSMSEVYMGPKHSIPAITLFSLSMLFAFVNVYLSLLCFLIVPMLYFIPTVIKGKW
jgi:uncharacterized membrane protein